LQQGLREQAADEILVRRFVDSEDREAFAVLVRRYSRPLRRLLFTLLGGGPHEDIEDAEQEIFTELFLHLASFRHRSSFKTYFYRLARNRAIDFLRRRRVRQTRQGRLHTRLRLELERTPGPGPEEALLARVAGDRLLSALLGLGEEERMLIVMKDSEKMAVSEIAAVLAVPEGTVKSRLHRARAALVRRLREEAT
jgi:RNA polymerase sigma-70 factor (ECF subfamily)